MYLEMEGVIIVQVKTWFLPAGSNVDGWMETRRRKSMLIASSALPALSLPALFRKQVERWSIARETDKGPRMRCTSSLACGYVFSSLRRVLYHLYRIATLDLECDTWAIR